MPLIESFKDLKFIKQFWFWVSTVREVSNTWSSKFLIWLQAICTIHTPPSSRVSTNSRFVSARFPDTVSSYQVLRGIFQKFLIQLNLFPDLIAHQLRIETFSTIFSSHLKSNNKASHIKQVQIYSRVGTSELHLVNFKIWNFQTTHKFRLVYVENLQLSTSYSWVQRSARRLLGFRFRTIKFAKNENLLKAKHNS